VYPWEVPYLDIAIVDTHFHLDRESGFLLDNLGKLIVVFARILQMLGQPSKYYREGPIVKLGGVESWWADAWLGGFHLAGEKNAFTFRPKFPDTRPTCRSAIRLHEGAHFCGQVDEIGHFAMEFPPPEGAGQDGCKRNYRELPPPRRCGTRRALPRSRSTLRRARTSASGCTSPTCNGSGLTSAAH